MALRWASVGACENAGVATANRTLTMNAVRVAAGINVLIIFEKSLLPSLKPTFNGNETLKKPIKNFR
jgi:hypothetical protein